MRTLVGPERELPGEWATVVQIAAQLGLSRQRVDQLRREQRLPAVRTPHGWLYNRAEVSQWGHQWRKKVSDVSQTPKSAYSANLAPPAPEKWAPGLNEHQLAVSDELEFELPPDAPTGLVGQALLVAAGWRARSLEAGFAGRLKVPDAYADAFASVVEPSPPPSPAPDEPEDKPKKAPAPDEPEDKSKKR